MTFTKLPLATAALLATMAFAPVASAEGLSFNIGAVSLYKSNGIDQDNRQPKDFIPAIQGGVDYDFGNGFYVGNWNSTGKFGEADLEIDLYAGYAGELASGISYDLGVTRFIYPDEGSFNANELYASVSYGIFTTKYTRGFGNGNKAARLGLSIEQPLTSAVTLNAGVGFRNNANFDGAYDFNAGLTYDLGNDLSLSGVISGAQKSKTGDSGKTRLVLGIAKSF